MNTFLGKIQGKIPPSTGCCHNIYMMKPNLIIHTGCCFELKIFYVNLLVF